MAADGGLVDALVGFGQALREAGLPVGTDDVMAFCAATAELDPSDVLDVFWAGRTTLIARREHLPVYDEVFRRHFLGEGEEGEAARPRPRMRSSATAAATLELPEPEGPGAPSDEDPARIGLVASPVEVWRSRAFPACTPEELAALRRIASRIRLAPPRRRTRRFAPARDGRRIDLRRTAREAVRRGGDPEELRFRARRLRLRPMVLLLDVSGSMSDHSRDLLSFAHATRRAAGRVEVFCFGTRLTRITRQLDRRRPDEAIRRAAEAVVDWDGGTRIGESLDRFVREHARRGTSRGAVVVICSDGFDRGDAAVLADAMERLARLSHRIVWIDPNAGGRHGAPSSGMLVAGPWIDEVLGAGDLADLERVAALLPALG